MSNNTITMKNLTKYILVGVAVVALILAAMNLFGLGKMTATMSAGSLGKTQEQVSYNDLKQLLGGGAVPCKLGNILFGIVNLIIAAIGFLHFGKDSNGKRPVFRMGLVGAIGAVLQILLFMLCTSSGMGMKLTITPNWTTYFALILYIVCIIADMFYLRKKD